MSSVATFIYPTAGQGNVDAINPFTWTPVAGAQGYALAVGTTHFGTNLAQTGVLPVTQTSYRVPALPTGSTLYATLLTEIGGVWGYTAIAFSAAPGDAFTYPTDGQTGVDITKPFTWSTVPGSQGSIMVIGLTRFGTDQFNSGLLPASQTSIAVPSFMTGHLYATLLTKTNGGYTRYQAISFTAAPAQVTLVNSYPLAVQVVLDDVTYNLAAGQQLGPVPVIAPSSGNDNVNISVASNPSCGIGDDFDFFDSGKSYRFTVITGGGTCGNGTRGPDFAITPT